MKRIAQTLVIALFVALALMTSANALFYTDFRSPRAVCTEDSLKIDTVHNGRVIDVSEIRISAEDEYGSKFDVSGNWYIKGEKVNFLKGGDPSEFTDVEFISDTKFPKNENYRVFFSYKRSVDSYDYTTLQIVANCPGKLCTSNIQCAETERCEEGRCANNKCNVCQKPFLNACVAKCEDNNVCTKDSCDEGICSFEKIDNCCAKDSDCDDDLMCSDDICIKNRCTHEKVECVGNEVCVSGQCEEGTGCVYETNLTCLNEENRRYVMQLGTPKVVQKETLPRNIWSAIINFLRNFFG
jgi:hypothetical protein